MKWRTLRELKIDYHKSVLELDAAKQAAKARIEKGEAPKTARLPIWHAKAKREKLAEEIRRLTHALLH